MGETLNNNPIHHYICTFHIVLCFAAQSVPPGPAPAVSPLAGASELPAPRAACPATRSRRGEPLLEALLRQAPDTMLSLAAKRTLAVASRRSVLSARAPVVSAVRGFQSDDQVPPQEAQVFGRRAYELEVEKQGKVGNRRASMAARAWPPGGEGP